MTGTLQEKQRLKWSSIIVGGWPGTSLRWKPHGPLPLGEHGREWMSILWLTLIYASYPEWVNAKLSANDIKHFEINFPKCSLMRTRGEWGLERDVISRPSIFAKPWWFTASGTLLWLRRFFGSAEAAMGGGFHERSRRHPWMAMKPFRPSHKTLHRTSAQKQTEWVGSVPRP